MKALTIKEPWASLIVDGYKKYEFRSWKTSYRGRIYIHAAKKNDMDNINKFSDYNLKYGCGEIIGEAVILDCVEITKEWADMYLGDNPVYKSNGFNSKYAFCLGNVKRYKKGIKCTGKLSLWNYEEDV